MSLSRPISQAGLINAAPSRWWRRPITKRTRCACLSGKPGLTASTSSWVYPKWICSCKAKKLVYPLYSKDRLHLRGHINRLFLEIFHLTLIRRNWDILHHQLKQTLIVKQLNNYYQKRRGLISREIPLQQRMFWQNHQYLHNRKQWLQLEQDHWSFLMADRALIGFRSRIHKNRWSIRISLTI